LWLRLSGSTFSNIADKLPSADYLKTGYNPAMLFSSGNNPREGEKLKVLFVSAEVAPYTKIGGLADVAWALPRALRELGHDVRVFSAKYGIIDEVKYQLETVMEGLNIQGDKKRELICNVKAGIIPEDIPVYLLENQEYYEIRANVYGYADDTRRWVLLCRGALEFLRRFDWSPDVIHVNDWQTGYLPNDLVTTYRQDEKLQHIATVFSIHNIKYQGTFDPRSVSELDKDDGQRPLPDILSEKTLKLNGMRRGIIHSDLITTVSPTYAREILQPEFGNGLDRLLRELRSKLFGVLNGLDSRVFDPEIDKDIWVNYNIKSLDKKVENKLAFQKEFGLTQDPDVPVVGFVGRMNQQKGLDLIIEAMNVLLPELNFQFIIVGAGSEQYENEFYRLMKAYPQKVGGHLMLSKIIGQQIYAASDIFLYPSQFEPCGLAQLIAMRYGSVPIVRKTGGLADTVEQYDPKLNRGTGFMFENYDGKALLIQLAMALEAYRHKDEWQKLVKRAMSQDFSWTTSAEQYSQLYVKAMDKREQWLKKEGIIMADTPSEVPGKLAIEPLK
jgi:starch synthase